MHVVEYEWPDELWEEYQKEGKANMSEKKPILLRKLFPRDRNDDSGKLVDLSLAELKHRIFIMCAGNHRVAGGHELKRIDHVNSNLFSFLTRPCMHYNSDTLTNTHDSLSNSQRSPVMSFSWMRTTSRTATISSDTRLRKTSPPQAWMRTLSLTRSHRSRHTL